MNWKVEATMKDFKIGLIAQRKHHFLRNMKVEQGLFCRTDENGNILATGTYAFDSFVK